jgi:hypothetical protein
MSTIQAAEQPTLNNSIIGYRQAPGRTHICTLKPEVTLETAIDDLLDRAQTHRVRAVATLYGTELALEWDSNPHKVFRDYMVASRRS